VSLTRRDFAIVEEVRPAICESHEHESTATDIACGRFDDGERECNCDGSVDGVPAALQNFDSSLRAELFVGREPYRATRAPLCFGQSLGSTGAGGIPRRLCDRAKRRTRETTRPRKATRFA